MFLFHFTPLLPANFILNYLFFAGWNAISDKLESWIIYLYVLLIFSGVAFNQKANEMSVQRVMITFTFLPLILSRL